MHCLSIISLLFWLFAFALANPIASTSDALDDIIRKQFDVPKPFRSISQSISVTTALRIPTPTPSSAMSRTVRPRLITIGAPVPTPTPSFSMTRTARPRLVTLSASAPTPTPTPSFSMTRTVRPRLVTETSTTLVPTPTPSLSLTRTSGPKIITTTEVSAPSTTTTRQVFLLMPGAQATQTAAKMKAFETQKKPKAGKDPLVLDTNHDGNVTASRNTGISLDPTDWFKRTGGATGGDKMLAMCDLNKNGVIDGTEVFGDMTKFPLIPATQPTYNGFIAIRMVARSLEAKFPNISIVHWLNGSYYVMLHQLQSALKLMDCDLGLISDDNRDPKKLEPLGDALGVDISKWTVNATENIDLTGMASYQQGRYIDEESRHWKANDVWFKA